MTHPKKKWLVFVLLSLVVVFTGAMIFACGEDSSKAPAIPHNVASSDDSSCLGCHQTGISGAPIMSHAVKTGCVSCHKPPS